MVRSARAAEGGAIFGLIGRVFGAIRLLVLVGMVPGSILGGVVADHWGTRAVLSERR